MRHGHKLALKRHHHDEGGAHAPEWQGLPSITTVLITFGVALVIVASLTLIVAENCALFHICSDYVRDAPRVFRP